MKVVDESAFLTTSSTFLLIVQQIFFKLGSSMFSSTLGNSRIY